jgi:FMN-dependent NADH-azoreductase
MKNILLIQSSPRRSGSLSRTVAQSVVHDLQARQPQAKVVIRDLAANPPSHVGLSFIVGIHAPTEKRAPDQAMAVALSDGLVDELLEADVLVIGVPMHNFGLPSTLKAWIDHIVRPGRTFSYGANGPEGLVKGKRVILVLSRGGVYSNGPAKPFDFQEPYLRIVLGFLGITEVDVVHVEGVATDAIGPEKALAAAIAQSKQILARAG